MKIPRSCQCSSQTFFGHKLRIEWFSDTQKPPLVVAECSKIFDAPCIWGRIFVSLEKIFVFKYFETLFNLVFRWIIHRKKVTIIFSAYFLGADTVQTVPEYIWIRSWLLFSNNVKSKPKLNFYILLSDKNQCWHWL